MFQDEKTELKKENETYDSIIQKEIISNENTNKDIKLTSDENIEENNCFEKILNNSITNKIIEYENLLSKKVYDYLQTYHIESSYRNFVIFLIIGLIFIFKSVIDLPTFNLTPIQFLIFFNIGNIFIFFALFFYYGSLPNRKNKKENIIFLYNNINYWYYYSMERPLFSIISNGI